MPDKAALDMLVTRPVPAISADGSKPDVAFVAQPEAKPGDEQKTDAKAETKAEAKQETKVEAKEADDKSEGEGQRTEKTKDETPPWMKRELTKSRNKERAAEAEAREAKAQLAQALTALERATGKQASDDQSGAKDPKPQRKDFTDPDQYESKLVEWSTRQGIRVAEANAEAKRVKEAKETAEKKQREYIEGLQSKWADAREKILEVHTDYEDVAESEDLQISHALGAALLEVNEDTGDGPKLAYWLGQNPDEAARLSKLSLPRASLELGRIAERLSAKPAKEKRAADPIKPIGGRSTATADKSDPKNFDMEKRLKEIRAANRPFFPAQGRPN